MSARPSKVQLRSKVPAGTAEQRFMSHMLTEDSFDLLLTGNVDVHAPDGKLLAALCKDAIPEELYVEADDALTTLRSYKSENRAVYAGGFNQKRRRQDGTLSGTNIAVDADGKKMVVASAIVGYFDRNSRFPFCRETRFTASEVGRWRSLFPLVQQVSRTFAARVPDRYAAQAKVAAATEQAFVIPGSPFTTLTVNNTVRGACHRDVGDLKAGFGCITARRRGHFRGFYLVFPEYRIAVDIGPHDLLLFDAHEMHGNTPMTDADPGAERISVVYYYREAMRECGSPAEEHERAVRLRGALVDDDTGDEATA